MTEGSDTGRADAAVRVFISYARDNDEHVRRVRSFWLFLRTQGIDARLDLPVADERQDWQLWNSREIQDAAYVLGDRLPWLPHGRRWG